MLDPDPRLVGHSIALSLEGAAKWVSPPLMPPDGTVPAFSALDLADRIFVSFSGSGSTVVVDTDAGGSIPLIDGATAAPMTDLDLSYDIGLEPANVIHVLDVRLTTTAPGIAASDIISVILSPDGADPVERLHHASLFTERYQGEPVPEPSTGLVLLLPILAGRPPRRGIDRL